MPVSKRWSLDMSAGPIFEQIAKNVRQQLARGDLAPGDRLPSARDLAATLSVNPNTVVHAYSLLEQQDVIEKRRGLGTFVRPDAPVPTLKNELLHAAVTTFLGEARQLGVPDSQALAAIEEGLNASDSS